MMRTLPLILSVIWYCGCMVTSDKGHATAPNTSDPTLADTLRNLTRDFPEAPTIVRIGWQNANSVFCPNGVCVKYNYVNVLWSPVNGAIGYNLYSSWDPDTGFKKVTFGTLEGTQRWGILPEDKEGVLFYKVAALNESGTEGQLSERKSIYYPGN